MDEVGHHLPQIVGLGVLLLFSAFFSGSETALCALNRAQLERLRLIRDVEVNQEVFVTLRNQLEIAKIEEAKERLFINILDRAEPSINKEHPRTILLLIIFSFLGVLFSLSYLIVINNLKKD